MKVARGNEKRHLETLVRLAWDSTCVLQGISLRAKNVWKGIDALSDADLKSRINHLSREMHQLANQINLDVESLYQLPHDKD